MTERILHCWKDSVEHAEELFGYGSDRYWEVFSMRIGTCMLSAGHEGPHSFTPDDEIGVIFSLDEDGD